MSDEDWKQIHKDYKELYFPEPIISGVFLEKSYVPIDLKEVFSTSPSI